MKLDFREIPNGFFAEISYMVQKTTSEKVGEKVGDKVGDKLTKNQQEIIKHIIINHAISARELAGEIGISQRKIEENIAKLKKLGRLKRIGPAKTGHWEIVKK